jgi:hypothetical protein
MSILLRLAIAMRRTILSVSSIEADHRITSQCASQFPAGSEGGSDQPCIFSNLRICHKMRLIPPALLVTILSVTQYDGPGVRAMLCRLSIQESFLNIILSKQSVDVSEIDIPFTDPRGILAGRIRDRSRFFAPLEPCVYCLLYSSDYLRPFIQISFHCLHQP